jgi:hypothetical protein
MLHGYTQSGPLFRAKTRALEKNLLKAFPQGIHLAYPTAPHRLSPADVPGAAPSPSAADDDDASEAFAWWRRRDPPPGAPPAPVDGAAYDGLDEGLAAVARALRDEGPFDGVVGFSQGGALAALVASLLEPGRPRAFASRRREALAAAAAQGRGDKADEDDLPIAFPASFLAVPSSSSFSAAADEEGGIGGEEEDPKTIHPPLRFAVSYSGFASAHARYAAFYDAAIATPTQHFLGTLDAVVAERRSLALVERCASPRVVRHPGGHFLPASQREFVAALVAFVREAVEGPPVVDEKRVGREEKVEDMDLPF